MGHADSQVMGAFEIREKFKRTDHPQTPAAGSRKKKRKPDDLKEDQEANIKITCLSCDQFYTVSVSDVEAKKNIQCPHCHLTMRPKN